MRASRSGGGDADPGRARAHRGAGHRRGGGKGLMGKKVIAAEGVELGYVSSEDERFLTIAEGPVGHLRLGRRFVADAGARLVLRGASRALFSALPALAPSGAV